MRRLLPIGLMALISMGCLAVRVAGDEQEHQQQATPQTGELREFGSGSDLIGSQRNGIVKTGYSAPKRSPLLDMCQIYLKWRHFMAHYCNSSKSSRNYTVA